MSYWRRQEKTFTFSATHILLHIHHEVKKNLRASQYFNHHEKKFQMKLEILLREHFFSYTALISENPAARKIIFNELSRNLCLTMLS